MIGLDLLTTVAVDMEYLPKRWKHRSFIDCLKQLMQPILRADGFAFVFPDYVDDDNRTITPDPDALAACQTLNLPTTEGNVANMLAGVLEQGGLVVSADMRLWGHLVHGGTVFRPQDGGWETYRHREWDWQYRIEPEHWPRFCELTAQSVPPYKARKICKTSTLVDSRFSVTPQDCPMSQLSATAMSHFVNVDWLTNENSDSISPSL